ncbi:MAG: hypothetical protein JWQ03_747 [Variovorax sp.]|nr:hypothetical protein [Variovorax sp.]
MHIEGRFMTELIAAHKPVRARMPMHAEAMRSAGPAQIETALTRGREQLLGLFEGFERALGSDGLRIALDAVVNLPLWELGHIGWFEEFWLLRNRDRALGPACNPLGPRSASLLPQADAFYDSSNVAHGRRWQLALPDPDATRGYLAAVRQSTLALLRDGKTGDDDLYFFRLVLFHEDMHREAWHFMAQRLGIDLGPAMTARMPRVASVAGTWNVPGGLRRIGAGDTGFAFDNELRTHAVEVPAFSIDRVPVNWASYLAFVEAGGYAIEGAWTLAGREWLRRTRADHPMHLRHTRDGWQRWQFGSWAPLDPAAPALHLTAHEAEAWCRWAGRRLPTEAEWETAAFLAAEQGEAFEWGEVWEWTASRFGPYPGFAPHPYRDYSQPWFDGRPVLRGGSFATTPHMKHPCYRNFFIADRNDVFSGFRTCAVR